MPEVIIQQLIRKEVHPGAPPLVSVIVVNWNRRDLLRSCLASLAAQQGAPFEVIVVDNGSDDDSARMVADEFSSRDGSRYRLITNQENRGFCAANNQGIQAARGRFIALLNNDAEAEPMWLREMLRAFEGRDDIGMAASKVLMYEEPHRIDKAGHLIYLDGQNRGRGSGQLDDGRFDTVEETLWPDGCAAMYRKDMLLEIGGFDEDLFAYADDAELGLRARIAGWKCLYIPTAVVRHHRGASLGVLNPKRLQLIERNRVLLAAKLFPWSLLLLNPFYYSLRLAAGLWASLRGRGEAARFSGARGRLTVLFALLRGDLAAVRLLPRFLGKRAQVDRIRRLPPAEVRRLILSNCIPLTTLSEEAI